MYIKKLYYKEIKLTQDTTIICLKGWNSFFTPEGKNRAKLRNKVALCGNNIKAIYGSKAR